MTSPRSPLREFTLATPARPRGRVALAAFVILALAALLPLVHGGDASAKKGHTVKAGAAASKGAKSKSPQRSSRRFKSARSGRKRVERKSSKPKPVRPTAETKSPTTAPTKPKSGSTGAPKPAATPDESQHEPARKDTPGNPTPSPAGAGGGGESARPDLPRPAHAPSGSSAPASSAPSAPQPTTPAGTVPTTPLPVTGERGQHGSRGPARRGAERPTRVRPGADVLTSSVPPLVPVSRIESNGSAPVRVPERARPGERRSDDGGSPVEPVTRTVRDIVEVVPAEIQRLLLALAGLSVVLGAGYLLVATRARRLARQRADLLQEVGLLQAALLPPVPTRLGAVQTSVAYRPADGPAAGGDFYDALMLPGGRAAFILGDVSGHGRAALARTAFVRYTLRAYLEAGIEPRTALQVAGRVVDEHLGGDFATVLVAVHDPRTGSLTYASAGHPAPIVLGGSRTEPVLAASSPPVGLGMRTGLRQTTLPLPPGSLVCLYTDGLTEARTESGILGRPRLGDLIEELGPDVTATQLLDAVAEEARLVSDDMAAVVLSPTAGVTTGGFRTEQLEVDAAELDDGLAERFLDACGADLPRTEAAVRDMRQLCEQYGGAVLHVRFGIRGPRIEVVPRNVESLEAASKRALALAR